MKKKHDSKEQLQQTQPKFPDVIVKLSGADGNAFYIMGLVRKALIEAGYHQAVDEYLKEAMSDDYDHLLVTTTRYVTVI